MAIQIIKEALLSGGAWSGAECFQVGFHFGIVGAQELGPCLKMSKHPNGGSFSPYGVKNS